MPRTHRIGRRPDPTVLSLLNEVSVRSVLPLPPGCQGPRRLAALLLSQQPEHSTSTSRRDRRASARQRAGRYCPSWIDQHVDARAAQGESGANYAARAHANEPDEYVVRLAALELLSAAKIAYLLQPGQIQRATKISVGERSQDPPAATISGRSQLDRRSIDTRRAGGETSVLSSHAIGRVSTHRHRASEVSHRSAHATRAARPMPAPEAVPRTTGGSGRRTEPRTAGGFGRDSAGSVDRDP